MNKTTLKKLVITDIKRIIELLKENEYTEAASSLNKKLIDLNNDIKQKGDNWLVNWNIFCQLDLIYRSLQDYKHQRHIGQDVYWLLVDFENIIDEFKQSKGI
jgi:hypothetical protein